MPSKVMIGCLVACMLGLSGLALAQSAEPPLIAVANGQVFIGDENGLMPFAACQPGEPLYGTPLSQSPSAAHFALPTLPQAVYDVLQVIGGVGGGPLPSNLWLCDVASQTVTLIAPQPDDLSFFAGDLPDLYVVRSSVVWSGDGARLAWTEMLSPGDTHTLVIYDIAAQVSRTFDLSFIPLSYGIPTPFEIAWTDAGILATTYTLDETTFEFIELLYVVNPEEGALITNYPLSRLAEGEDYVEVRLVLRDEVGDFLALRYSVSGWVRVNLMTGDVSPMIGEPAIVAYERESLVLLFSLGENYAYNWAVLDSPQRFNGYDLRRIAIAPDGQRVAYADADINIWDGSTVRTVPGSEGFADDFSANMFWTPLQWRLVQVGPNLSGPVVCPGLPVSRLRPGMRAQVNSIIPNNVRNQPTLSGQLVGQLPGNGIFMVIEGPQCADGYAWFRIEVDDLTGWTAEGTASGFWLDPLP